MITGGGTGGHVYPALTVMEAAERLGLAARGDMLWVGTARGMEQDLVPRHGIAVRAVTTAAFVGRGPLRYPGIGARVAQGVREARAMIRDFQPDVVLATGGYVSVPAVLGARWAGVPSVIYLPDVHPGVAVKFLARFAKAIAVTDEAALADLPRRKTVVTGYPVRQAFANTDQASGRAAFGLADDLPTVLILGGSQGSASINAVIRGAAERLLAAAQVIHVTGNRDHAELAAFRDTLPQGSRERYVVAPFLDAEMAQAFAAADLVVCRAGASTLGELPVSGKASILVPGSFARGHQMENAERLAGAGAGVIVPDAALEKLPATILDLVSDEHRLRAMGAAARSLARPDAAERIAGLLDRVARGGSVEEAA